MKKTLRKYIAVCVLLLIMLAITGCSGKLSEKELAEANQAFSDPAMCCFFTCYYSDPREIDLFEFLQYCPVGVMLTDADTEEFLDWTEAAQWPDPEGKYQKPSEFYVPIRRLTNADVSAILMQYAGITTADLDGFADAVYLEKYDAFYNYTSDYAPGHFECIGGEINGTLIRFWSETDQAGNRDVLILEKVGEQYFIRSFLQEKAP